MAGYDDSIFGNLPSRPLPGSPRRPKPPPDNRSLMQTMFPVDPREVVGGLSDLATQGAGRAAAYAAGHGPLDALAPAATAPASAQSSADKFGGDITAMLQSPTHGGFNPDTAMHATLAAAPLALAARTGRTAEEIATGAAKGGITAYHGSPYNFDRFDMSKIGTGEGAQAYGHGLYFAENPAVADMYSRVVTANQPGWNGVVPPAFNSLPPDDLAKIPDELRGRLSASWQNNGEDVARNLAKKMFEESRGTEYSDALHSLAYNADWTPPGHRYQVDINANPDHFLDWDKSLSEQHPQVQQKLADTLRYQKVPLNNNAGGETTGGQMMGYLEDRFGRGSLTAGKADATDELRDAGIPGIKYLDQGSRGVGGEGTHNYVTFSDDIINILKKYGLAGLGLTAGAGALSASGQSPVSSPAEAAPPPQGMPQGAQPNWSP